MAVACYQSLLGSSFDDQLLTLSRVLNGACLLYGVKILIIVIVDTFECTNLDSADRGSAQKCIDIYESYAAISSSGADSPCASLNINTETLLGGVCPNVYLGDSAGVAVLALEIVVAILFLVLNSVKIHHATKFLNRTPTLPPYSSKLGNIAATAQQKPAPQRTPASSPRATRAPISSIYTGGR